MTTRSGDEETLQLPAADYLRTRFQRTVRVAGGAPKPNDGVVQVANDDEIQVKYGYGYFGKEAKLPAGKAAAAR